MATTRSLEPRALTGSSGATETISWTDGPAQTPFGGRGDDVGIFRSSAIQSKFAKYDGGKGCDTLVLELTKEEATSEEFLAELAEFNDLQHRYGHKADCAPYFIFVSFGLKGRNWEKMKSSS